MKGNRFRGIGLTVAMLACGGLLLRGEGQRCSHAAFAALAPDAVALGKNYAPVLTKTYADAWVAAADALESGKSVAESKKVFQDSWKDLRERAFRKKLYDEFKKVLPEGTEPVDAADRLRVSAFWRSFASGLRQGP